MLEHPFKTGQLVDRRVPHHEWCWTLIYVSCTISPATSLAAPELAYCTRMAMIRVSMLLQHRGNVLCCQAHILDTKQERPSEKCLVDPTRIRITFHFTVHFWKVGIKQLLLVKRTCLRWSKRVEHGLSTLLNHSCALCITASGAATVWNTSRLCPRNWTWNINYHKSNYSWNHWSLSSCAWASSSFMHGRQTMRDNGSQASESQTENGGKKSQ